MINFKLSESPIFKFTTKIKSVQNNVINNNAERLFMNENLATKKYITTFFDFIIELKKIYGDGFQIMDIANTISLTPKIYFLATEYNSVKNEFSKLSNTQISELSQEFSKLGIDLFYTDNNSNDKKLGINNLTMFLDELFKIVNNSIAAAKDGIDLTDLVYAVPIGNSLVYIIMIGSPAFEELKHLGVLDISQIVGILVAKLLGYFR